jgi:hypothetical protein
MMDLVIYFYKRINSTDVYLISLEDFSSSIKILIRIPMIWEFAVYARPSCKGKKIIRVD